MRSFHCWVPSMTGPYLFGNRSPYKIFAPTITINPTKNTPSPSQRRVILTLRHQIESKSGLHASPGVVKTGTCFYSRISSGETCLHVGLAAAAVRKYTLNYGNPQYPIRSGQISCVRNLYSTRTTCPDLPGWLNQNNGLCIK